MLAGFPPASRALNEPDDAADEAKELNGFFRRYALAACEEESKARRGFISVGVMLRSFAALANAARLIEGQPALATLRFLQTLEASNAGQTFVPCSQPSTRGAKPSTPEPGET